MRASITRLGTRLKELEDAAPKPDTTTHARQLLEKLKSLDKEFRGLHYEVIDLIDDGSEDTVEAEQVVLDKHDDDVAALTVRLESLAVVAVSSTADARRPLSRRLSRLQTSSKRIRDIIHDAPVEHAVLKQCQEEVSDYKKDLATVYNDLISHDIDESDELSVAHSALEIELSEVASKLKGLLAPAPGYTPGTHTVSDTTGVRLPKLDVPTFDGNIIHWTQFWEQFTISVHDRKNLSNAEKIVYLQHALKDGSARSAIEGLSNSGDNYDEAVKCLKSRFDRPRLIHRTHVQIIVDTPPLKEGNGKELRRLHDDIQQHVRALKTLGCELPGQFITSMIELKLDTGTLFEWQKHCQSSADVPPCEELLGFIDLRAQASETSYPTHRKKPSSKITSFTTNTTASSICVVCKTEKHPLYTCAKFKSLSHDEKLSVLKVNNLYSNCLSSGHFKKQCRSIHKCKVCQKPHHTFLHVDQQTSPKFSGSTDSKDTTHVCHEVEVQRVTHDMSRVCPHTRWFICGSQSTARQCLVRLVCFRTFSTVSLPASF